MFRPLILGTIAVVLAAVFVVVIQRGVVGIQKCNAIGDGCCAPDGEVNTKHCHKGFGCNINTSKCEACGAPGQPCCDGDFTGFSLKGYNGFLLDPTERIDSCNAGGRCDAKLAPGGESWLGTRMCLACGTQENGNCCAPDVRYGLGRCFDDATSGKRLVCNDPYAGAQGTCVACGQMAGQLACMHGFPCEERLVDDDGICVFCGEAGQLTCDRGQHCFGASVPNKSYSRCVAAGGANQPCLPNGDCTYGGLFCNRAKICEPCGEGGLACCPPHEGRDCQVGECVDGRCFACGYENMPVCTGSEPCHAGEPVNGFCRPCGKENQVCCRSMSIRCEDGMRCQEGNVCKRPPAPSSPPQENWKTCNGEIWTITTVEHTIFIENNNGCAVPAGFIANSLEDALECARNIHGEDVIGPTVGSSMFAVTCPTIGCTQMYRSGRDQDGARDCIEAEFPTCDVEDGPCP